MPAYIHEALSKILFHKMFSVAHVYTTCIQKFLIYFAFLATLPEVDERMICVHVLKMFFVFPCTFLEYGLAKYRL